MSDIKKFQCGDRIYNLHKFSDEDGYFILMGYQQLHKDQEVIKRIFSYVSVIQDGNEIFISSEELINKYIFGGKDIFKIEFEILAFNFENII